MLLCPLRNAKSVILRVKCNEQLEGYLSVQVLVTEHPARSCEGCEVCIEQSGLTLSSCMLKSPLLTPFLVRKENEAKNKEENAKARPSFFRLVGSSSSASPLRVPVCKAPSIEPLSHELIGS